MSCYSQLLPCGHLAIMDTPKNTDSCWIPDKKLQTFWLKQTPNITDLQTPLLVPTRISISTFWHLAELSQFIIYFFLFLSSSLSLWLKSEHSDSLLTWSFCETTGLLQGLTLQPVGSLMWPAFTQWRQNFQAWLPTWPPRYVTFFFGKMYTNDNLAVILHKTNG